MRIPFTFNGTYFVLAATLFIIEVLIALFIRDSFVRPYLGDVLVVILIYCFIKSFIKLPVIPVVAGVLLLAFTIEILQYMHIVDKLHIQSTIVRTVLGTSFAWNDILAYMAGAFLILLIEKFVLGDT